MLSRNVGAALTVTAVAAVAINLVAFGPLGGLFMIALEAAALVLLTLGVILVRHLLDRRP